MNKDTNTFSYFKSKSRKKKKKDTFNKFAINPTA